MESNKLDVYVSPKVFKESYVKDIMLAAGDKGEWFDLCATEDVQFGVPRAYTTKEDLDKGVQGLRVTLSTVEVSLGIAIKLPPGFEAIIAPRSSLYYRTGLILTNSIGVIDSTYCGNDDVWKAIFIATRDGYIKKGQRICQFRIQPSQKANAEIKRFWNECNGINFITVDRLDEENRGGFGSTD